MMQSLHVRKRVGGGGNERRRPTGTAALPKPKPKPILHRARRWAVLTVLTIYVIYYVLRYVFPWQGAQVLRKLKVLFPKYCSKALHSNEKGGNDPNICGLCGHWEDDYAVEITNRRATRCQSQCDSNSILLSTGHDDQDCMVQVIRRAIASNASLPRVLYHTGDELCNHPDIWDIYQYFDLVFRNYACDYACTWHYKQLYRRHTNVMVIPLPYMKGFLNSTITNIQHSLEVSQQLEKSYQNPRQYAWAFIGQLKSNRRDMLKAFDGISPHFNSGSVGRDEVFPVYANASFVLSGRGELNLDCLRHSEASLSGAIPVVQGEPWEINATFGWYGENPPWIFARTWEEARSVVQDLLSRPDELAERRREVLRWWQRQMIRTKKAFAAYAK